MSEPIYRLQHPTDTPEPDGPRLLLGACFLLLAVIATTAGECRADADQPATPPESLPMPVEER